MPDHALPSGYEVAEDSPGLLLWRVTNAWQATIRAALAPHGLTHVQFVLLASLTWLDSEEPVTQARLAEHARVDVMMASQVLRALEAKGLVERRAHPGDARAKSLVVTPEGGALAARANLAVEAADRMFFAPLAGVAGFTRHLAALADGVPDVGRRRDRAG